VLNGVKSRSSICFLICRQENIYFVNHSENFLLKNGKIVNELLYSDGVHLTKNGTSLLINNINDKVGILKHENDQNETPPNVVLIIKP
jgi:hypothetical protein